MVSLTLLLLSLSLSLSVAAAVIDVAEEIMRRHKPKPAGIHSSQNPIYVCPLLSLTLQRWRTCLHKRWSDTDASFEWSASTLTHLVARKRPTNNKHAIKHKINERGLKGIVTQQ